MRETTHARAARAAAVSRALRRAGISPLGADARQDLEGVRVTGSILGATNVVIDLDAPARRARVAENVTRALQAAGYTVTADAEAPWDLTVKKG